MRFLVVDIETNGMEPPASLIELGWQSLDWYSFDRPPEVGVLQGNQLFGLQPGEIMSPDVRAVHHISPEMLEGLDQFDMTGWADGFDADYSVAHNAEFETKWLDFGKPWICTYKCALRVWPDAPSHGNQALKYFLGVEDRPEHHPPHRALPDAIVTTFILQALLDTGTPVETLVQWSSEPRLLPSCPIGKFRGKPWAEVEWGFLNWMLKQPDMEHDLKWNAQREIDRRNAPRPQWNPNQES